MTRVRIAFSVMFAACLVASVAIAVPSSARENPFLTPSTLPLGAPDFSKITDTDYLPAIEAGMAQRLKEVEAIANNPAPPTFENTFVALEKSGRLLDRAYTTFSNVQQANTDDTLDRVQEVIAPKLAANEDAVYLNSKLFARVRTIHAKLTSLHLDPESHQLANYYYDHFEQNGALLRSADKAKLRDVNQRIAVLEAKFERQLLASTAAGALVVDDPKQLAGLSDNQIAAAAQAASSHKKPGKWMLPLQNTTQQPALQSLENRDVREELFDRSVTRAEKGDANDTRDTIATLAQLRAQKARLLGYPNFASYALVDEMAKNPQNVEVFLRGLIAPTSKKIDAERAELQAAVDKSGQHFDVQPYDWEYYAEQVRKTKFALDDNEIRPYFELDNVLHNGLFYAANQLYGVTFNERHDIPVYNPDVRVFEVHDKDGSLLGLMYFDFFKRDNKSGGAWMSNFINESTLLGTKPVIYNVENFTKPAPGQPALLTFDNVTGMFHEFGHALNGFFANTKYPSLSGAQTSRDFVEFPSQFNEHWALYPKVFKHFAFHYETHRAMPQALMDKIHRAATFNQGYALGETLAADEVDMAWHTLPASAPKQNPGAFEAHALKASGSDFTSVPPRYHSTYFAHIWSSGYAAGYYAYAWSEMLDDDAYQWFLDHGGLTRANGQRFRDMILSRGHTQDLAKMFRAFYGKDPDVRPLLKFRGLI